MLSDPWLHSNQFLKLECWIRVDHFRKVYIISFDFMRTVLVTPFIALAMCGRFILLPSARKLRQGNIFTAICQSFSSQEWGCLPQWMLGYTIPRQTPPRSTHPESTPPQKHTPKKHPSGSTPPGSTPSGGHCSGRYASYWNAFLL